MSDAMKEYWHRRIAENQSLIGTGHRAFTLSYNQALYEMQRDTLDTLLRKNQVNTADKQILDVGSGTGFYVDYFLNRGAANVTGLDIAPSSIEYLQHTYTQSQFYCVDIGRVQTLPVKGPFDIISVISVFYHIIETESFEQALTNICQATALDGYLILSDMFSPTWQLTAKHVKFRPINVYESIFEQFGIQIIDILPIYYLMNRTYIPLLMPPILSLKPVTRWLMTIDDFLRRKEVPFGSGLKMLLAKKVSVR